MGCVPERTRGPGIPCADAVDWSAGWTRRGRIHCVDGTIWRSSGPGGSDALAAADSANDGIADHGISAVPLFSRCTWQRCAADEGGIVRARGKNHAVDRIWKILLHVADAGKRNPVGARGTGGASWRRDRFGARKGARVEAREGESPDTGRRGGSRGRSV